MPETNPEIVELKKTIEHQQSIIATYETVSGVYRRLKRFPVIGKVARRAAGVLRPAAKHGVIMNDNVVSENPELIGVCNPRFAGGVKSSTYSLCADVVEVSEMFDRVSARKVAEHIAAYRPAKLLVSGYSVGYDLLIDEIKKVAPETRIFAYVHSAFIWFDTYMDENPVFYRFLEQESEGLIEKIGFCKRDVSEYFRRLGHNSFFIMNRFELKSERHSRSDDGTVRIGIWGANLWHRNILNQVIAALMVPGSEVHVNQMTPHDFLDKGRIVVHGLLPKEEFAKVFSSMDINMYVSFTDCFPMTLVESMEQGIPCIASDTSDVYSFSPELKSSLVVSTIDGPIGISEKIVHVLANYGEVQDRIAAYLPVLSAEVEKSIEEFLA